MKDRDRMNVVVLIGKENNVLAYCDDCRKSLLVGDDTNRAGKNALRGAIWDHINATKIYDEDGQVIAAHETYAIYVRRASERFIDGETYVTNNLRLTMLAELQHKEVEEKEGKGQLKPLIDDRIFADNPTLLTILAELHHKVAEEKEAKRRLKLQKRRSTAKQSKAPLKDEAPELPK